MYSDPLSGSVSTSGANPEEKQSVMCSDSAKAAEFRSSAKMQLLLNRLQQFPEVRANVVAVVAARWHSSELMAGVDSESVARAILQSGGE